MNALQPRLTTEHLSAQERQAWQTYNATRWPVPRVSVLEQFADSVREHGQRPAVADEVRQLTYAELDQASDGVARQLAGLGVRRGDLVGILDGRCVTTYAGLVGILKAGAAFVPLNPAEPGSRTSVITRDCGLRVILSPRRHIEVTPVPGVRLVDLSQAAGPGSGFETAPAGAGDIAYVIYTSGSTGVPKGVRIRHESVTNLVAWAGRRWPIRPDDHVAQMSPLFFDPCIQQIFPAWASGACLVPVPLDLLLEPAEFVTWLARRSVTHLDLVTPHWAAIASAMEAFGRPHPLPDLRWLVVGGESMYYEQVARWHKAVPGPGRILNIYGPTEATVNATEYLADDGNTAGKVSIGQPLPNYEIFVVDDSGRVCAPSVVGEIYIAGVGVADGYVDPAATLASFVPDPRPGMTGSLYRTGDTGRLVPDGTGNWGIEFAGRRDSQVKISGYRIELEDIESAVLRCPAIKDGAVVVAETAGGKVLLCLFVADHDAEPVLRDHLATALPAYMMPGRFRRVRQLEFRVTGKLDREAMARMYGGAQASPGPAASPATQAEAVLHDLWAAELGTPDFAPTDSFFDLGGSSLAALSLIAQAKSHLGVPLRVIDLYRNPGFTDFAGLVEERLAQAASPTPGAAGARAPDEADAGGPKRTQ
jgi:amino acid adenylation domain-containing protein